MNDEISAAGPAQQARSPRFRSGLLAVLLVLLLASAASVAYLAATRPASAFGVQFTGGEQDQVQADREQVMSQAEQFMLRINTYGPDLLEGDEMPKYRKLVEEVITPKFAADFDKNVPAAEATVKQAQVERTAQVFSTGVASIDSDSATALVAGAFTQSYPESAGSTKRVQTDPAPFRVTVQLVKIKGTWLVDDFAPVTDADSDAGGSGSGSTDLPSSSDQPTQGVPNENAPSQGAPSQGAPSQSAPGRGSASPATGASQ